MALKPHLMPAFERNIWDWGKLDGCFPGQEGMMDVDGIKSHVSRRFLAIEAKEPTADLNDGQRITYERLLDTGHYTLIVVWGKTDQPERCMVCHDDGTVDHHDYCDMEFFRDIVKEWWQKMNREWIASGMKGRKNKRDIDLWHERTARRD